MDSSFFKGSTVVVTGAAGTVGKELSKQLLKAEVAQVRCVDNDESDLFFLGDHYRSEPRVEIFLTDVRSRFSLDQVFSGADYVFHAAALKHVTLGERNPFETVQTNVIGVQNVIQAAISNRVGKVLFTSTDKAVNPTNVMGTTKLMGERLFTAAHAIPLDHRTTIFASTRFGNVAGSAGSVIPLFARQIARKGPLTLTHLEMTRFVMTLADAVNLLLKSLQLASGGEVFITKMKTINIADLAQVMVALLAPVFGHDPEEIPIKTIGPLPGEKMYEELMNEEEIRRALELDNLFVVLPALRGLYDAAHVHYEGMNCRPVGSAYNSSHEKPASREFIAEFLLQPGVLPEELRLSVRS